MYFQNMFTLNKHKLYIMARNITNTAYSQYRNKRTVSDFSEGVNDWLTLQ